MTALTDALRALALHQDLLECAQAADEIERLRGLVEEAHSDGNALMEVDHEGNRWFMWACQVCPVSGATQSAEEAAECRAAHVRQILDGGA